MRGAIADPPDVQPSYDPSVYESLVSAEERHFWFRARRRAIAAVFELVRAGLPAGYRVLEVGCGSGDVLRVLESSATDGTVIGMDLYMQGLQNAKRRIPHALLVRGDATRPPFSVRFDVVGMFDVLEHLDDDVGALRGIGRLLTDEGFLLLSVPADPRLWSYFDTGSRHKRRYRARELRAKLIEAGFAVVYLTPYMSVLHPVLWLGRRFTAWRAPRPSTPSEAWAIGQADLRVRPVSGAVLDLLLAQELRWLKRRRRLPMGASILCIAQRR